MGSVTKQQQFLAVARAVYVAVSHDAELSGSDAPSAADTADEVALRGYIEGWLDGYQVSSDSLASAVSEGPAITHDTLAELITQASDAGLDLAEAVENFDLDIEQGLAAAQQVANPATGSSVREQLFKLLQDPAHANEWLFITPGDIDGYPDNYLHHYARQKITERELPASTPYAGWDRNHDVLRPDGTIKHSASDPDWQQIYYRGDLDKILELLHPVETLGFAIEQSQDNWLRLVPADDPTSQLPFELPARDDIEVSSTDDFAYSSTWNERGRKPKNPADVLSPAEAEQRYLEDETFFVYPAAADPVPWSMRVEPRKQSVVTHYHRPSGSVARVARFDYLGHRSNQSSFRSPLARRLVTDYLWPADHTKYAAKSKASQKIITACDTLLPTITREDLTTGEVTKTKHRDGPAGSVAIKYPEFGDWSALVNPWFGEPGDESFAPKRNRRVSWRKAGDEIWADEDPPEHWKDFVPFGLRPQPMNQRKPEVL